MAPVILDTALLKRLKAACTPVITAERAEKDFAATLAAVDIAEDDAAALLELPAPGDPPRLLAIFTKFANCLSTTGQSAPKIASDFLERYAHLFQ